MDQPIDLAQSRNEFLAAFWKRSVRQSSLKTAVETIKFLRKVVIHERYESISDILESLASHGRYLWAAQPSELVIRNAVLMVAKLVREENSRILIGSDEPISPYDSLNKLWKESEKVGAVNIKKLKKGLIEAVKEVAIEMESCRDSIAGQAAELIQTQDVLIVHGLQSSATLDAFLAAGRRARKHRVLSVVGSSQFDSSPEFVSPLQLCDVGTKMNEATKVVLSGAAVFPDGSCLVPAGGLSICLSAQRHSVPVYVLAAFYKITPFFVPDPCLVNPQLSPGLPFSLARQFAGKVEVLQPAFDVIPASLVTLYVSNSASLLPSHIYRLIGDYYHPEDVAEC